MQHILAELTSALRERVAIVCDEESRRDAGAHMNRLKAVSERIEDIETRLPPAIDAQLRHFLRQRSYSKALEFLESM